MMNNDCGILSGEKGDSQFIEDIIRINWSLQDKQIRPVQDKAIRDVMAAINKGYENIILEAGTGVGKSAIATTIARMYESAYILTMSTNLQSQYMKDFRYMLTEIKGRTHYPCKYGGDCKNCNMEESDKPKCKDCKYLKAFFKAMREDYVNTNYDFLYYVGNFAKQLGQKELLILDEAHNLDSKLMTLVSRSLNREKIIIHYGIDIFEPLYNGEKWSDLSNDKKYWANIINRLIDKDHERLDSTKKISNFEIRKIENRIKSYYFMKNFILNDDVLIEMPSLDAIKKDEEFTDRLSVDFKPFKSSKYSDYILDFGKIRLFMSGTIGSKNNFCKMIGLNPAKTEHIEIPSPFPVENRPIYTDYVCNMGSGNWDNPKVKDKICEIIGYHDDEKGVIHTTSHQQSWKIKNWLDSKNVWVVGGKKRDEMIKAFEKSDKPITLVGAGIKDGVDFKGDKCRYQIILKCPFPSLGSKQVNMRKRNDPEWYLYNTVMPLMQAYGRGIRDMDDYCTTYVLDEALDGLINDYEHLFNNYFLEALR